jgi:hypothetical protein
MTAIDSEDEKAYVELKFWPSLELIPVVRRFVSAFYERLLAHADAVARLALATHELLENTVKFSSDGVSCLHLGAIALPGATRITIRTRNQASERHRAALVDAIAEIQGAESAFHHYQELMRRNARRHDGSGLGLARIRAEAEMELECALDGGEVSVLATAIVAGELRATGAALPAVADAGFSAATWLDGGVLAVRLTGNADLAAKDALEELMPRVHAEALRARVGVVSLDLTAVEFMNSSCFRSLVSWVSDVQDLPVAQRYRIRLLSNSSVLWQRRSLHALKCFADDLVEITAPGSG